MEILRDEAPCSLVSLRDAGERGGREIFFSSSPTGPVRAGPGGVEGWTPAELPSQAISRPAPALCGWLVGWLAGAEVWEALSWFLVSLASRQRAQASLFTQWLQS